MPALRQDRKVSQRNLQVGAIDTPSPLLFVGAGFAAMVAQLLAAVSQLLALILGVVHARKLLS